MSQTGRLSVLALVAVVTGASWHAVVSASPQQDKPIHLTMVRAGSGPVTAGKTISVDINAEIDPTWHLYGLTEPPGPVATSITIPKGGPFTIDGDIGTLPPKRSFDQNFGAELEFYEERTTFTVPVKIASSAKGKQTLTVEFMYQTCNDRFCLPPTTQKLTLDFTIGGTDPGRR